MMGCDEEDVLVELSDDELEELAKLYEGHKKEFPLVHSFLQNCLKSKKIGMKKFVQVYCPCSWKVDGTFIASMPVSWLTH